ncbi:hypothetical protein CFP56_015772 [Quercus suber]|uniref:Uncharacterized protein n=1 Tax=Quercus suber TaxID=58331 RepID=A0AAW0KPH7_QUESU
MLYHSCGRSFPWRHNMEDLAQKWKTLSLTETEDTRVDLSRDKKKLDFVLATKFFTRRSLNIERYDGSVPVQYLCFDRTSFCIQIHNLPFSLLMITVVISIGEKIGTVTKLKDVGEMKRGSFIRVHVEVDISKPLCRERKISWDQNSEGWATFQYKRLPNICY